MIESRRIAVIGVGNEYRGDDGAGLEVVRALKDLAPEVAIIEMPGDGTEIIDAISTFDEVILVDASRSNSPPGTVREFIVSTTPLPVRFFNYSTHAFGLAEAIELVRTLGKLPEHVIVVSIEGQRFQAGMTMSEAVVTAVRDVADTIRSGIRGGW